MAGQAHGRRSCSDPADISATAPITPLPLRDCWRAREERGVRSDGAPYGRRSSGCTRCQKPPKNALKPVFFADRSPTDFAATYHLNVHASKRSRAALARFSADERPPEMRCGQHALSDPVGQDPKRRRTSSIGDETSGQGRSSIPLSRPCLVASALQVDHLEHNTRGSPSCPLSSLWLAERLLEAALGMTSSDRMEEGTKLGSGASKGGFGYRRRV